MTNGLRHPLTVLILAALTVFVNALGIQYGFDAQRLLYASPNLLHLIAVLALYFLYRQNLPWHSCQKRLVWCLAALSAILSLGYQLHNFDTTGYFSRPSLFRCGIPLLILLCNTILFRTLFDILFLRLSTLLREPNGKAWRHRSWFLLFLICSLPSYIALFPGTIQWDNGTMLQMAYGIKPLSNDNPLFHTGLMYLLRLLTERSSATFAIALYTLLQTLLQCWLMAAVTVRLQAIHKKFAWTLVGFYLLMPAFGNYAASLGKDLPFALAILYFSLLLYDLLLDSAVFFQRKSNYFKLFAAGFLMCALRNIGLYLFLLSALPTGIYLLQKGFKTKALCYLCACACGLLASTLLLQVSMRSLQAAPEKQGANRSLQLQQVARVIHLYGADALTEWEQQSVDAVMDIKAIPGNYQSGYSDHIKDLYRENLTAKAKQNFTKAYWSIARRYPFQYIEATYLNVYAYYIPGIHTDLKPNLFYDYHYIDNIPDFQPAAHSPLLGCFRSLSAVYRRLPVIDIMVSSGFLQYLHLIVLCAVLAGKRRRYLLAMLPSLLYAIGLIASPINGYYRYCLPTLLTAGTSLLLMLRALQETTENVCEKA